MVAFRKRKRKVNLNSLSADKLEMSRYLRFMALNSWATSFSNVLSTNSMLGTLMGSTPSYTSVIATTYIGKDIIGQMGGLLYAWRTGKRADHQPVSYMTRGALIQQASFYLENLSPFVKNGDLVLPFLGISSTLKNVSFITTGAVNASNLQKIAKNNIGEFYSKVASLNTFASTFGMVSGIVTIHLIPSYTVRTLAVMPVLSLISVYSLRKATEIASIEVSSEKEKEKTNPI